MIKLMLLAKRKEGMTRDEFIDYYENTHVPLGNKTFPSMPKMCTRRRNYILHDQVVVPPEFSGEVEYDVISEMIFHNKDDLESFMKEATNADIAAPYRDDEANLFDLDSMRFFFVETHEPEDE